MENARSNGYSPYGQMEDVVDDDGNRIGLSEQARLFLRHGVLPFPYNEAKMEAERRTRELNSGPELT